MVAVRKVDWKVRLEFAGVREISLDISSGRYFANYSLKQ